MSALAPVVDPSLRGRTQSCTTKVSTLFKPDEATTEEGARSRAQTIETATIEHRQDDNFESVNSFRLLEVIGKGAFGVVRKAECDGVEYAIKCISKKRLRREGFFHGALRGKNTDGLDDLRTEIASLKKLNHPHIVRLIEVMNDPNFDTVYMVFELLEQGPVMKMDSHPLPLSEATACNYFRQLLLAVEVLHMHRIIHRDIKPENILKFSDDEIKLADFGVSHIFDEADTVTKTAGTPAFFAPEACESSKCNGMPLDVWAMGVTLYCFLFARLPWTGDTVQHTYENIKTLEPSYQAEDGFPVSVQAISLLQAIFQKNPVDRVTIADMRNHPWLESQGMPPLMSTEENTSMNLQPTSEEVESSITNIHPPRASFLAKYNLMKKKSRQSKTQETALAVDEFTLQQEAISHRPPRTSLGVPGGPAFAPSLSPSAPSQPSPLRRGRSSDGEMIPVASPALHVVTDAIARANLRSDTAPIKSDVQRVPLVLPVTITPPDESIPPDSPASSATLPTSPPSPVVPRSFTALSGKKTRADRFTHLQASSSAV